MATAARVPRLSPFARSFAHSHFAVVAHKLRFVDAPAAAATTTTTAVIEEQSAGSPPARLSLAAVAAAARTSNRDDARRARMRLRSRHVARYAAAAATAASAIAVAPLSDGCRKSEAELKRRGMRALIGRRQLQATTRRAHARARSCKRLATSVASISGCCSSAFLSCDQNMHKLVEKQLTLIERKSTNCESRQAAKKLPSKCKNQKLRVAVGKRPIM